MSSEDAKNALTPILSAFNNQTVVYQEEISNDMQQKNFVETKNMRRQNLSSNPTQMTGILEGFGINASN